MDSISSINNICTVSNIFPVDGHPNIVNNDNICLVDGHPNIVNNDNSCLVDGIPGKVISGEENQSEHNVNDNICPVDDSSSINNMCTVDNLEGTVDNLEGTVDNLEGTVDNLEGNPNQVDNDNIFLVDGISGKNILNVEDICQLDGNASVDNSSMYSSDMEVSNDGMGDFDTSQLNISNISLAEDDNAEGEDEQDVSELHFESEEEHKNHGEYVIPVHINNDRPGNKTETRERVLTTVNLVDKRTEASMALPTVAVTNFRSLEPKLNNVTSDMLERELDIVLGSETWQKDSNKTLKANIEKMLEEHGLAFKSCPRPSTKRGGGSAVIVNTRKFSVEKLPVLVPHKLEVVWCLVRPKEVNKSTPFKEIIVTSFYSAPNYRKNNKLVQHLINQMHLLLVKYPRAGFLCGGDRNKMDTQPIEDALPKCKQIVTKYTYKNRKVHDIILTNMSHLYALPFVVPAVCPDVRGKGVPSDHDMAVALPLAGAAVGAVTREYRTRTSRPMPDSAVRQFGQWITTESWSALRSTDSPSQQGLILQDLLQEQVNNKFPTKQVRVSNTDKPWITAEIKKLDRWKKEEYKMHGRSKKYEKLLKSYNDKFHSAAKQHLRLNVTDLMEAAPGRAWAVLKKMGAAPGECGEEGAFTMTEHLEDNLTVEESLEKMVVYFSAKIQYSS